MFKFGSRALVAILAISLLGFMVAGCDSSSIGGGGGGGVGKSPISGATLDALDANGVAYANIGTTTTTGAINFTNLPSGATYPLRINATGGRLNGGTGAVFTGTLRGVLTSASGTVFITPASTIVTQLYEAGYSVAEAEQTVKSIVQNAMGLSIDPLADFTASDAAKQNNELAQQALLFALGVPNAETSDAAMQNLEQTLTSLSTALADGDTVDTAVAGINSGYTAGSGLNTFVDDNIAEITSIAEAAIDETITTPTVDIITKTPGRFYIENRSDPSAATAAITVGNDDTSTFAAPTTSTSTSYIVIGLNEASGGNWAGGDANFQFTTLPTIGALTTYGDVAVTTGVDYDSSNGGANTGLTAAPVFKYTVTSPATAGTDTIAVKSTTASGETVTRTITINIVDPASDVTSSSFDWGGNASLIKGLTDTNTSGTSLAKDAYVTLAANDVKGDLVVLGSQSSADVNAKYRVSFEAPAGFGFYDTGYTKTWTNYDQATTMTGAATNWSASVPFGVKLRTTKAMPFGEYTFKAKLIDKDTGSVERTTTSTVYLVRSGATTWPAKITTVKYDNSDPASATSSVSLSITDTVNNRILLDAAQTDFTGTVLTWANLAAGSTGGPGAMTGNWYLTTANANSGFGVLSPITASDNYDMTSLASYAGGTITLDAKGLFFTPNYGTTKANQDSVSISYIDTTNDINLSSTGSVTITSTP